jgi:uncharacterized protein (TIGR02001 family)
MRIRRACLTSLLLAGSALSAHAQLSGSLGLLSDYRYRGLSLSDGQPAVQASVAYDYPSGWYAGLFGATVRLPEQSGVQLQLLSYLGYARALRPGLSWDAGAAYVAFTGGGYAYPDLYVGVGSERLSLRVHYDFDYFGQQRDALYVETNAVHPLTEHLQLIAHLGLLRLNPGGSTSDDPNALQLDFQLGIGIDLRVVNVRLTWEGTNRASSLYTFADSRFRPALVLGVSHAF